MTMLRPNKEKLVSNWSIYYLTILFLVAFLFHFSQELEAKNNTAPAAEAGLVPGDIILEVDQTAVGDLAEFNRSVEQLKEGDTVLLLVDRGGTTIYKTLRIW